jgi:diguanylate cyclase (GGDEF)-like protein
MRQQWETAGWAAPGPLGPGGLEGSESPSRDRLLMALAFALLFGLGGALGTATLLTPGDPGRDGLPLGLMVGGLYGLAATCLVGRRRLPLRFYELAPALGSCAVGGAMLFAGPSAAPVYGAYLFWIALAAFYFFEFRLAYMHAALASLAYGAALVLQPEVGQRALYWMVGTGSIFLTGSLVALLRSRTEAALERAASAACEDPLTGLQNRRVFDDALRRDLARAKREQGSLGLILFDLDRFKELNDRVGHQAGDRVLRTFGAILHSRLREMDGIARLGGDEFAVIAPGATETEAYRIAERVRGAVEEVERSAEEGDLSVSAGVSIFPRHGDTPTTLFHRADMALYAAKRQGRNRTAIYSSEVVATVSDPAEAGELAALVSLAEMIDIRHYRDRGHGRRVGRFAAAIGRSCGLDEHTVSQLRLAGVLHDIGKIGVPPAVFEKAGSLTPTELAEVQRHPQVGARMVRNAGLDEVASWIAAHHERPDGCGYPAGLSGDQIPLGARILAVAEAYDAMTSERGYRAAMTSREAREELLTGAGTQFHPQLVADFVGWLERRDARRRAAPEAVLVGS